MISRIAMTHSMHPTTVTTLIHVCYEAAAVQWYSSRRRDGAGTTSKGEKAEHLSLLLGGGGGGWVYSVVGWPRLLAWHFTRVFKVGF